MNPVVVVGAALILFGLLLSRRTDARTRAGQLLAGLSPISPTEALNLAALRGDAAPYLAIKGSIDAPEIFEDEHHRPLVFRRERVSIADEGQWRVIDTAERSLPFVVSDPSNSISIATADLADGLVVVERRWEGSVADLHAAGRDYQRPETAALVAALAASDPTRGARVGLEQISNLDRATAAGQLLNGELRAGAGRPLVVTTLDRADALRLLGSEGRGRLASSTLALVLLALGVLLLLGGIALTLAAPALGADAVSPSPTPTPNPESGDARNGGVGVGPGGLLGLVVMFALPLLFAVFVVLLTRLAIRSRR
ncbi:MAG: hypothetical protein DWI31_01815 [Candidatus Aquidulcis sp.]|nr:MAG: hypothetical protein DWI31_01815 [Candidatus Aquidulcis sp.]